MTVDSSLLACIVEHGRRPRVLDVNPHPQVEGREIDGVVGANAEDAIPRLFEAITAG